jgi:hypothetical protein
MRVLSQFIFTVLVWPPLNTSAMDITSKKIERIEHPGIELTIEYPYASPTDEAAAQKFNELVDEYFVRHWPTNDSNTVDEYKRLPWELDDDKLCPEGDLDHKEPDSYCQTFLLNYSIDYRDGNLLSIRFYKYWYTGGLHGYGQTITFNYNTATAKEVELSSLFTDESHYLERLAKASNMRLKSNDCLTQEVLADTDYFTIWSFDQEGLSIFWSTYTLGGYNCGEQKVKIPYAELADILYE